MIVESKIIIKKLKYKNKWGAVWERYIKWTITKLSAAIAATIASDRTSRAANGLISRRNGHPEAPGVTAQRSCPIAGSPQCAFSVRIEPPITESCSSSEDRFQSATRGGRAMSAMPSIATELLTTRASHPRSA